MIISQLSGEKLAALFMGIDVGTTGVRIIICSEKGKLVAQVSRSFPTIFSSLPEGWIEQNSDQWWEVTRSSFQEIILHLRQQEIPVSLIRAVSVDSTSGTIIPVDEKGNPLRPAILYNDSRASREAERINESAANLTEKMGYRFQPSFALPKILWIKEQEQEIYRQTYKFIHATDYINGKLTGNFDVTDTSNVLKTGFDLVENQWPDFIGESFAIDLRKLPRVVKTGEVIGHISRNCAQETGLETTTKVVAGATDGTAAFIASGAVEPGDWNSTLGTTLVIRGVSRCLIKDPRGRIYCHIHPEGYWLPGGASNVGGECLEKIFSYQQLSHLDQKVPDYIPSSLIVYPLVRRGERFPFINEQAQGFVEGIPRDQYELYAGYLEGVGYVERWCYDLVKELGAELGDKVYTTGGGTRSEPWLQIRADILNKILYLPLITESAMGAAIIAASRTYYSGLTSAVKNMLRVNKVIYPQPDKVSLYSDRYLQFRALCRERGWE